MTRRQLRISKLGEIRNENYDDIERGLSHQDSDWG
jgi:hypothetical protein